MTPLEVIRFIVERLEGTSFEPWVNVLLFLVLLAAVFSILKFLIGKRAVSVVNKGIRKSFQTLDHSMQYSPGVESFRLRTWPYVDLITSLLLALVGIYSALTVGLVATVSIGKMNWKIGIVALIWIVGSFIYMRVNLAQASWAYHRIKNKS